MTSERNERSGALARINPVAHPYGNRCGAALPGYDELRGCESRLRWTQSPRHIQIEDAGVLKPNLSSWVDQAH